MAAAAEVELGVAVVVFGLEDTGTTDTETLLLLVVAAEQAIVTYTVWVTVEGRRLMVCVGPAPWA